MIGIPEYVQKRDTGNVPFDANLSMTISNEIIINLNGVENLYYAVNPTIKKEDVLESDLTDFFKNEVAVSLGISHLVTNDTEAVLKKQWFGV